MTFALLMIALAVLLVQTIPTTAHSQTTNRDAIRAKIEQLEKDMKNLDAGIVDVDDFIRTYDSNKYVFFGYWPVERTAAERRLAVAVLTGQITYKEAIAQIQAGANLRREYVAELRREKTEMERELEKARNERSYYINELSRLNEVNGNIKVPMKVSCTPSMAPPGASVQCTASVDDRDALKKLADLVSAGGKWGYYWYVSNLSQSSTGPSIPVTIPKTGGVDVVARLMVADPAATTPMGAPRVTYEADYGGGGPAGLQLQEVGRAGTTVQAQAVVTNTRPERKKYGPFAVPWGSWFPTSVQIKKGQTLSVKATGAFVSVNQNTDVKTCGPDGCGYWRWFVLKAKVGTQMKDVGSSGWFTADQDGVIELGSPRGGTFVPDDAKNCTGTISVEVWVEP
jgi:hypothetical protein